VWIEGGDDPTLRVLDGRRAVALREKLGKDKSNVHRWLYTNTCHIGPENTGKSTRDKSFEKGAIPSPRTQLFMKRMQKKPLDRNVFRK
jgi:hypothetical protein